MPDNLTNDAETHILECMLTGQTWDITNPLSLALSSVLGTDSSIGTEVSGGSYARESILMTVSGNTGTLDGDVTFAGMPATDCQGWAIYESGAMRIWWGLWEPKQGTAQNSGDTITIASHGYTAGQKVVFQTSYVPPGLSANTTYYVKNPATDTFQVSATNGGSVLTLSGDSALVVVGKVLTVLAADDFDVEDGNLTVTLS